MINVNQLRKGVTFELDDELYRVLDFQHHKPGRGKATIRTKLRNLRTGTTIDRNFISDDKVDDIRLDHRTVQYLYNDGVRYFFMDTDTYEQTAMSAQVLEDVIPYLKENLTLQLSMYDGEPLDIEVPITIELEVTETEPAIRGDTATGATKEAVLETGLRVQVPLFVQEGDVIEVDTRTDEYLTRA
jgi:elongation factor P